MNLEQSSRRRTVTTVFLACFVAQSFARFSFGLLLPAMKVDLDISYGVAGWLGTINLAGYLVGTLFTSAASLKVPPHRLVQIGVGIATFGMGILTVVTSLPMLLLGMAFGGIGGAMTWIPSPLICASVFPPERRAFAMGLTSAAIGAGIVVATVITRVIRRLANDPTLWRPIWLMETLIGILTFVLALALLRPVPIVGGVPPKLSVLRKVPRWWSPTAAYTCFGLGYVLFATFVVALVTGASFGEGHAAAVFAFMGIGNVAGALSSSFLLRRFGRRRLMPLAFCASGAGCLLVLTATEPVTSIATLCFGFGMSASVVCITSYLGESIRSQDFGAAFGAMTACFGVAQAIGPRLGGYIVDSSGSFTNVFVLAALVWGIGALCSLGLPKAHPKPSTVPLN